MKNYSIAIDGPAGSGKSTVAKQIAKKLNLLYIDTGAMYRAVGLYCLKNNIDIDKEEKIAFALKNMNMSIELLEGIQNIYLNGENVTEKINAKIEEMEKQSYRLVTMSFWGTERAVLVFKKGLKGSLL